MKNRWIYKQLAEQRDNGKITILLGARQVGKTTLMRQLFQEFQKDNPCLFLDLDIYSHYEQVRSHEAILNTLRLNGFQPERTGPFFLFLDEFQRYADISRGLKTICDHLPNVKIYASGSSSLAINEQIQESLAGRKRIVRIYPLNFREYLHFVDRDDLMARLETLSTVESDNLPGLIPEAFRELERFLIYGGYPEVALSPDAEKPEVLASIFDLYVKKDLVDFLKIDRIRHAKTLIRQLAINHGQETRYSQLAQVAGIDEKSAKNYLEILKETFIISVHTPWFTNRNKELVKMPKVYFLDNGVRNFFIRQFNAVDLRSDAAFLFEGYVIGELVKAGMERESIKFWRTRTGREVDVVLDAGGKIRPVEIKHEKRLKGSDFNGLEKFRAAYPDSAPGILVNLGVQGEDGRGFLRVSPFGLDGVLAEKEFGRG